MWAMNTIVIFFRVTKKMYIWTYSYSYSIFFIHASISMIQCEKCTRKFQYSHHGIDLCQWNSQRYCEMGLVFSFETSFPNYQLIIYWSHHIYLLNKEIKWPLESKYRHCWCFVAIDVANWLVLVIFWCDHHSARNRSINIAINRFHDNHFSKIADNCGLCT